MFSRYTGVASETLIGSLWQSSFRTLGVVEARLDCFKITVEAVWLISMVFVYYESYVCECDNVRMQGD